jgi:hypothetical protein
MEMTPLRFGKKHFCGKFSLCHYSDISVVDADEMVSAVSLTP